MAIEPDDLRARLLGAEAVSAARRERLEQEVAAMFEAKLSRGGRVGWGMALAAAVAFAVFGGVVLSRGGVGMDAPVRLIWCFYALANVGFATFAAGVLRAGRVDVRRLAGMGKWSPALTLLITLLLLVRAMHRPTIEGVLWVVFGVVCLIGAVGVVVYNRIATAEMGQREQMLRLELRLVEMGEVRS